MAEGAPLLREYRAKHLIEGSNPSLSAIYANKPLKYGAFLWATGFVPIRVPYNSLELVVSSVLAT